MERINDNTPVIPLPNPGEGGPVYDGNSGNTPVIPLPNPGEGGPVYDGSTGNIPVIPLPNPGEGGPVNGGSSVRPPIWLPLSRVRFLNAAFGYTPIRIQITASGWSPGWVTPRYLLCPSPWWLSDYHCIRSRRLHLSPQDHAASPRQSVHHRLSSYPLVGWTCSRSLTNAAFRATALPISG